MACTVVGCFVENKFLLGVDIHLRPKVDLAQIRLLNVDWHFELKGVALICSFLASLLLDNVVKLDWTDNVYYIFPLSLFSFCLSNCLPGVLQRGFVIIFVVCFIIFWEFLYHAVDWDSRLFPGSVILWFHSRVHFWHQRLVLHIGGTMDRLWSFQLAKLQIFPVKSSEQFLISRIGAIAKFCKFFNKNYFWQDLKHRTLQWWGKWQAVFRETCLVEEYTFLSNLILWYHQ